MSEEAKWVKLQTYSGPVYAEMAKTTLEKEGIPCIVQKGFLSSAYGAFGTDMSSGQETFVLVPEEQAEEAMEILRGMME